MKRILFSISLCLLSLQIAAQISNNPEKKATGKINVDELVVVDTGGTVYPKAVWQQLVLSGNYGLKLSSDHKTGFLSKLTADEIDKRNEKLPRPMESRFFKTGGKTFSFTEKDMQGTRFSLKELKGKIIVLNFWFINCPPCRMEIPQLNELVETYKENPDVVFIAVSLDDKYDITDFLKNNPFKYHIIDGGRYIASRYGINAYPTHVVLDKEGKVLFHTSGFGMSTVYWLKKSIEAGLAGNVLP